MQAPPAELLVGEFGDEDAGAGGDEHTRTGSGEPARVTTRRAGAGPQRHGAARPLDPIQAVRGGDPEVVVHEQQIANRTAAQDEPRRPTRHPEASAVVVADREPPALRVERNGGAASQAGKLEGAPPDGLGRRRAGAHGREGQQPDGNQVTTDGAHDRVLRNARAGPACCGPRDQTRARSVTSASAVTGKRGPA
jgi:hypothetical protein